MSERERERERVTSRWCFIELETAYLTPKNTGRVSIRLQSGDSHAYGPERHRRARLYASGARAGLEVIEDVLGEQRLDERDAPAHRLLPGLRRLEHQALDHLRHRPGPRRACTINKWCLNVYYCKQERSGGEVASSEGCRDV